MIDTKEVKYLIKFSGWGTPQSTLHQQSSDTAARSTAATATSTRIPIATTAAPSRPATATTTRRPWVPLPLQVRKPQQAQVMNLTLHHHKKHFVIKTKQDWPDISWST